ncbi:hypothetical protein ACT453_30045, partial [Bacillus sp. D-CC]
MKNQDQALIFEVSKEGRIGYSLPKLDVEEVKLEYNRSQTHLLVLLLLHLILV